jgi:hypothetical protein
VRRNWREYFRANVGFSSQFQKELKSRLSKLRKNRRLLSILFVFTLYRLAMLPCSGPNLTGRAAH